MSERARSRPSTSPTFTEAARFAGRLGSVPRRFAAAVQARPVAAHLTLVGTVAFSAGVHAGLVSAHFDHSPSLALAFAGATLLLLATAVALGASPTSPLPPRVAAATFATLIVAYLVFTERLLDPIGVTTKAVEAAGIVVALSLRPTPALASERRAFAPVYALLVPFAALVAMQAAGHHH